MTKSLWHRFSKKDFNILKDALLDLSQQNDDHVSSNEKEKISNLISTAKEGFGEKSDGGLDVDFLEICVGYILICKLDINFDSLSATLRHIQRYKGGIA